LTEKEADFRADLLDISGKMVKVLDFHARKGENLLQFPVENIPNGAYFLNIFSENQSYRGIPVTINR
jgi:hypothetical protein